MNKRTHIAGALAVVAGLMHWSCCGCDDQPTTPTVVATPTPTPTATPAAACVIRPAVPDVFRCAADPPPLFFAQVVAAQDRVRREHPEIFDGAGRVDQRIYTAWVARFINESNSTLCAAGGTDDEISVRRINSSEFSELYDLVTGDGSTWNNYIFTCRPSLI
jgi:hypothetical protein